MSNLAIADAAPITLLPAGRLTQLLRPGTPAGGPNTVGLTDDVRGLLAAEAVAAVGVSGGKDSIACALAVARHLDAIGHRGPRVLVHADLGRVEWQDSLPRCEQLATHLGWELMVERRRAGDMLARWEGRWRNNLARYQELACVKLILPWSTPSMRFCTSELKIAVIASALKKRFPGRDIVNVTGVRREESATRARMAVAAPHAGLTRRGARGLTWNAIIDWPVQDVLYAIQAEGLQLHEAYTRYGSSRVSCVYCIMSSAADLLAAAGCEDNRDVYVQMVELEARSTFAFQGNGWLADVAPHWLPADLAARVLIAKASARARQALESQLPEHLLYTKGWPTVMPTPLEADLIAQIRREIVRLLDVEASYLTGPAVLDRYAQLIEMKRAKEARSATAG